MHRLLLGLGIAALALVTAACSGATAAPATDGPVATAAGGDAITVVAKDLTFQTGAISVAAGAPVTIVLDNQDGAPHNIAIKDAAGADVFKGEIVSNTKVTYAVPALDAGTYTFLCEVHPTMTGTITAS
jgi:plastocyanin